MTTSALGHTETGWRPRSIIAAAFVVSFLVVQLTVPILALTGPRPARFGWHMYTTLTPVPDAWIEDATGELDRVAVDQLLLRRRSEADLSDVLVRELCRRPGAAAVITERADERIRTVCR
ncbi:MAG: hypothetical protein ACRDGV_06320 [Candidatus Limnocylindria bacterium]